MNEPNLYQQLPLNQQNSGFNKFANSDPLVTYLSLKEQSEFASIISFFQLSHERNKRNFGMSMFVKHLNLIHQFVVRDDGGDAIRGLVCGVLFGNGFLLVNTDRLKRLTMRSKSCVNGCFQKLGFNVFRETQDLNGFFTVMFPNIDQSLLNPRHWCIRKASDEAPICFIASHPFEVKAKVNLPIETYQSISYPNYPNPLTHAAMPHNIRPLPPPRMPDPTFAIPTQEPPNVTQQVSYQMMSIQQLVAPQMPGPPLISNHTSSIQHPTQLKLEIKQPTLLSSNEPTDGNYESEPEPKINFFEDIRSLLNSKPQDFSINV